MAVNNYFLAYVRTGSDESDWDAWPFDDADELSMREAWQKVKLFRAHYERRPFQEGFARDPVLARVRVSVWRDVFKTGIHDCTLGVVGVPAWQREVVHIDKKIKGAA